MRSVSNLPISIPASCSSISPRPRIVSLGSSVPMTTGGHAGSTGPRGSWTVRPREGRDPRRLDRRCPQEPSLPVGASAVKVVRAPVQGFAPCGLQYATSLPRSRSSVLFVDRYVAQPASVEPTLRRSATLVAAHRRSSTTGREARTSNVGGTASLCAPRPELPLRRRRQGGAAALRARADG